MNQALGFYEKILRMGFKLINHEIKNDSLFSLGYAHISITGTVVFEAWLQKLRAGFMGHPWYQVLDIPKIYSEESLIGILNEQCEAKQNRDLSGINTYGFQGYHSKYSEENFLLKHNLMDCAKNIAEAILK